MSQYDDPNTRVSDEFFLCRKVNYGKNGNFTRFDPIKCLSKKEIIAILQQHKGDGKGGKT